MRTPGADFELAVGLLLSEQLVRSRSDVARIAYCDDAGPVNDYNVVTVSLSGDAVDIPSHRLLTTSACGVCGTGTLDELTARGGRPVTSSACVAAGTLAQLPERLREHQTLFSTTGGTHAAALFDLDGGLLALREDVGRHNAVDKVMGWALLADLLPLSKAVLLVSGRSSYEIVQKAAMAGVPVVCSVSAPSSLAVDVAERFAITLVGFLRGDAATVYTGEFRISA
jgi:FdhD protein